MTSKLSNPKDIIGTKKLSLSTLPMAVIAETAVAMTEGAAKYGRHNYRAIGVRASVYYDATMRHLLAWWDEGQDIDPDSGLHHVTKAITSLMVLRDAMIQGKAKDDRPPSSTAFMERLNEATADVLEKYKDENPRHYTIKGLELTVPGLDDVRVKVIPSSPALTLASVEEFCRELERLFDDAKGVRISWDKFLADSEHILRGIVIATVGDVQPVADKIIEFAQNLTVPTLTLSVRDFYMKELSLAIKQIIRNSEKNDEN